MTFYWAEKEESTLGVEEQLLSKLQRSVKANQSTSFVSQAASDPEFQIRMHCTYLEGICIVHALAGAAGHPPGLCLRSIRIRGNR